MEVATGGAVGLPLETSAVVVSYYTGPSLFECIASILAAEGVAELVLVDNGNTQATLEALHQHTARDPRLIVLTGHGNVGFATGCNLGARRAAGSYLLFLNPDALLPADGVRHFLAALKSRNGPVLLGGKLVDEDGHEARGSRRGEVTPLSSITDLLRLDRLAPGVFSRVNLHDTAPAWEPTPVPVVSGACLFLRARDYWSIGGFDEGYFLHVEDIDLCRRFRLAGGVVLHVPDVAIRHVGGTSASPALIVERHKVRGFARYFRQHFAATYPPIVLAAVIGLLWLRYALRLPLLALRAQGKAGTKPPSA